MQGTKYTEHYQYRKSEYVLYSVLVNWSVSIHSRHIFVHTFPCRSHLESVRQVEGRLIHKLHSSNGVQSYTAFQLAHTLQYTNTHTRQSNITTMEYSISAFILQVLDLQAALCMYTV